MKEYKELIDKLEEVVAKSISSDSPYIRNEKARFFFRNNVNTITTIARKIVLAKVEEYNKKENSKVEEAKVEEKSKAKVEEKPKAEPKTEAESPKKEDENPLVEALKKTLKNK